VRKFVDLHLCPPIRDLERVREMVGRSSELGYSLVGIPLSTGLADKAIHQLQVICRNAKMDLVKRIDLTPRTPHELLHGLRRFRRRFEVVSVLCSSKAVARQAAKDRRVDVLSFSATNLRRRFFDHAEAELASNALSCLEIDMTPLLTLTGFPRVRLISRLRQEAAIAKKFNVPVIISSGATEKYLLRNPHDYAALAILFDLTTPLSLRAISEDPLEVVERNRGKLSPDYLAPGLRIVKSGGQSE
jgi:ribonuclease P/MRP protein subunit RPP1